MRKLLVRAALLATIAAGGVGVTGSSANAWSMWSNTNYGGSVYGQQKPCGFEGMQEWFWDKASSWQNGGSQADAMDYTGSGGRYIILWIMNPFGSDTAVDSSDDNRADSTFNYC